MKPDAGPGEDALKQAFHQIFVSVSPFLLNMLKELVFREVTSPRNFKIREETAVDNNWCSRIFSAGALYLLGRTVAKKETIITHTKDDGHGHDSSVDISIDSILDEAKKQTYP